MDFTNNDKGSEFLFVEKYRPRSIKDCILPKDLEKKFLDIVSVGEVPNMIFSGSPGVGKTTVAKALCGDLNLDYIVVNGSRDGNIDTLRGMLTQFASTVSFNGSGKVVILDEGDYLNPQSTQPALRGVIEEFSSNCRFIITCNYPQKIIDALHSRCVGTVFDIPKDEKPDISTKMYYRFREILINEGIEFTDNVLVNLINKHFPDFRKMLGIIQEHSFSGALNESALTDLNEKQLDVLISLLKKKDFNNMRKWVGENSNIEAQDIFRGLYDRIDKHLKDSSKLHFAVILGEYQYKSALVADREINLVAFLAELMSDDINWK